MAAQRISSPYPQQRGAILLWGMVFLLVMTVLALVATRMATTDIRIASNQIQSMLTYQGAETTLGRAVSLYYLDLVAAASNKEHTQAFGPFYDEVAGGQLNSTSSITMSDETSCPPTNGLANSIEMTPDAGRLGCRVFTVEVHSWLPGTGAQSTHTEGILRYVPSSGSGGV